MRLLLFYWIEGLGGVRVFAFSARIFCSEGKIVNNNILNPKLLRHINRKHSNRLWTSVILLKLTILQNIVTSAEIGVIFALTRASGGVKCTCRTRRHPETRRSSGRRADIRTRSLTLHQQLPFITIDYLHYLDLLARLRVYENVEVVIIHTAEDFVGQDFRPVGHWNERKSD